MHKTYDIAIIGAGAAGLMAAAYATELLSASAPAIAGYLSPPSIVLLEKMPRPGRKLNITGKGSCNITNAKMWDEFAPHIHPNQQFLKNAFYNFSSAEVMKFFESLGLELVKERGDRVYPKSKRAMDVTDALVNTIKRGGKVDLFTGCSVEKVVRCGNRDLETQLEEGAESEVFEIECNRTQGGIEKKETVHAKKILVTTGGLSYPTTGSTGDGYEIARSFGHSITPCYPSLTALLPEGYKESGNLSKMGKALNGLLLKNISLALKTDGTIVQEEFGDAEFTTGGLEGPLGFRVSRKAVSALNSGQRVSVAIDFKPALSEEKLAARIASDRERMTHRGGKIAENELRRLLKGLLPGQIIATFVQSLSASNSTLSVKSFTVEQLAKALKNWELKITGYVGYERAVVTAGGVSLKEVSPKTMESKLQKGLFFAGEVLDIDADTGGYNLQCAFSSAAVAITAMLSRKQ